MKQILLFITILTLTFETFSQNSNIEYGLYNVSLGGLVGGIGAVINKEKNEKPLKIFANGFWKGSIGGGMIHLSKISVGEIALKNDYSYSWVAKINNSLGTSMIENATLNRPIFSNFNVHLFGFNRLEIITEKKFKINYKLMPIAFLLNSYAISTSKFEINKTLSTGELVYSSNKITSINYRGYTIGTSIVMNSNFVNNKNTFSHELIHVYQYYDYAFINNFVKKPIEKLKSKSRFLSKNDFLYYDLQAPILFSLYSIEKNKGKYYENFYEKEAGFYSNTLNNF